jgi:N-formylmaleamate deformylase
MSPWQSGTLDNRGVSLHYLRSPAKRPHLLLLHGFSDDSGCWLPIANKLRSRYDITLLDARGHGKSAAPAGKYGYTEHSSDVAAAIAALGLNRPVLLGHSMGAITALETARRFPKLIAGIALEDPPPWWVPARARKTNHASMQAWIRGVKRHTSRELIEMAAKSSPGWAVAERMPWAAAKLRTSFEVIEGLQAASPDWGAALKSIKCPTLLIRGDTADGSLISADDAAALERLMPQTQHAYIARAGHSIRRDAPAGYLKSVKPFFDAVAHQAT